MSTKTRQTVIGVIGDAQIQSERHLEVAEDLGAKLSKAGYVVASGGLSGIMEAVFRGAQNSGSKLTTKTVAILPGHDAEAANDYADVVIPTGLDIARNSVVVHSDAVIIIGGFGQSSGRNDPCRRNSHCNVWGRVYTWMQNQGVGFRIIGNQVDIARGSRF